MILPKGWPTGEEMLKSDEASWPVQWLRRLAWHPHQSPQPIGKLFFYPNGSPPQPFAANTDLRYWMLMLSPKPPVYVSDEKQIVLYRAVPLYAEEYELVQRHGIGELGNPPLLLSERVELLRKAQDPNVNLNIEHFKTQLNQLHDIDKYISNSSEPDKQFAKEAYALRDTLTQDQITYQFANGIGDFLAYKLLGGDPMIEALLAGNEAAAKAYVKNESVANKGRSIFLNPLKEFYRLGGYGQLKKLIGESEFDELDTNVLAHADLLSQLVNKGATPKTESKTDSSQTGSGQTTDNPPPPPPSEDDKVRMAIGDVNRSNPTLWFDDKQFGERYRISDTKPRSAGDWVQLNQFCSLLSLRWLDSSAATLKFSSLSQTQQLEDAETLINFEGLESQVSYAVKALNGKKRSTLTRVDLDELKEGAKIWFGNDRHVMAAKIGKDGQSQFYDPDIGSSVDMSLDNLAIELVTRGNVYVVA